MLKSKYNITNTLPSLPYLFWIPKFHKTPVDFRYITSGRHTVSNVLSKQVSICLKHLLNIERTNCEFLHKFDNIKNHYIIDNDKDINEFMRKSNNCRNSKNVKTSDFKTLYTNIPQDKLKDNINAFISSIFKLRKKKYIAIGHINAYFSDKASKYGSFSEHEIISQINYLIDNCFINFNNNIFQQVVGIPMGTNSVSHMANIFLHVYEKLYVQQSMDNGNIGNLNILWYPFRYQDDLIVFESNYVNDTILSNIYPTEMIIKNTNKSITEVSYLDLSKATMLMTPF